MKKTILAAGGDLRQIYAAEKLSRYFTVFLTGFDNTISVPDGVIKTDISDLKEKCADFLLLPVSVSSDGTTLSTPMGSSEISLRKLTKYIFEEGIVFGGKTDIKTEKIFTSANLEVIDYLSREDFCVLNAVPTAEGALQIILEELPVTLFGSDILITGYGRIAKVLARILISLGARVTVCARKYHDISWADINGCSGRHISELKECASECDAVFNTVPEIIFTENILRNMKKECLIIDLASKPGGTDLKAASELGIKTVWALGLPGKAAPVSAGHIIADTVKNILSERGMIYE